jgi:hypothetical protein
MEQINQYSEVKQGDMILIKFMDKKHIFNSSVILKFGVLRDDYDNKRSLSGCISKMITIYKISGNISEVETPRVFCWYKESFMLLGGEEGNNYVEENNIDIFKLNKQEELEIKSYINKMKIVNTLEQ